MPVSHIFLHSWSPGHLLIFCPHKIFPVHLKVGSLVHFLNSFWSTRFEVLPYFWDRKGKTGNWAPWPPRPYAAKYSQQEVVVNGATGSCSSIKYQLNGNLYSKALKPFAFPSAFSNVSLQYKLKVLHWEISKLLFLKFYSSIKNG